MSERICSKVNCSRAAAATLTYDYANCVLAIGPLSPARDPHGYDLCDHHADTLKEPSGWQVFRHSPFAGLDESDFHADQGSSRSNAPQ